MLIRKHWFAITVLLIAIVGVGLYLLATQPPPETVKIYKVVEPEKPTEQPKAQAPVDDTLQGGHVHDDGTWHAEPHETVSDATNPDSSADPFANTIPIYDSATMRRLEIEKRNAFYKERFGLGPPPEGYGYLLIDGNEVVLNPDGTPVLQQMELPDGTRMEYEIEMIEGFAPTREQWEHYQQLKQDREVALHRENRAEAARIQTEITQIEETARGLGPFGGSGSWMIPGHLDTPAYQARLSKMEDELRHKALIHMGMEYLIRPEGPEIYYVGPR
ncbi:hypothetical protein C6503_19860 [Candidatus Poribacteria bacterium]|nr:MAG: hypothetical protein C6503_19860 [Candidatus Poribacteria bacterium]